jgi:hypothetical protein
MTNVELQIKLFKEYGITNYTIFGDKITINGGLDLSSLTTPHKNFLSNTIIYGGLFLDSLTTAHKDFLKNTTIKGWLNLQSLITVHKDFLSNTTINGYLYLGSLTTVHKDFLKNTIINGWLDLNSLTTVHKDFLSNTNINGGLDLNSLTTVHKDFLSNTNINGGLDLRSLTTVHKDFLSNTNINGRLELNSLNKEDQLLLRNNVKQLTEGYFPDKGYCYFDGILRKVLSVTNKFGYTIYTTPFDYIAQKGNFTAHGKTIKKAILDLEFKILSEKLKNDPINGNTVMSVKHYRIITGACELGCKDFMNKNDIKYKINNENELEVIDSITASELLVMLEKDNAYGLERFRELVTN